MKSVSTSSACSWDARPSGATEAATWTFSAVRVHNCPGFGCEAFTSEVKDCGWTSGTTFHTGHTSIYQSSLPFTVLDYYLMKCHIVPGNQASVPILGSSVPTWIIVALFITPQLGIGGNWPLLMYELIYNPGTHTIACKTNCMYLNPHLDFKRWREEWTANRGLWTAAGLTSTFGPPFW